MLFSAGAVAAEALSLTYQQSNELEGQVQIQALVGNRQALVTLPDSNGFEKQRFAHDLKLRGWRVGDDLYFGQAKVADQWGIGLVLKKNEVIYGVNHRGLQITRQF